jgi:hypothetical protein
MLNFLPYKPTGPVSSNIYRPTINSSYFYRPEFENYINDHKIIKPPKLFVISLITILVVMMRRRRWTVMIWNILRMLLTI